LQFHGAFIQWFLIKRSSITYQAYSILGQFHYRLFFALNLAAIPFCALLLGKTLRQKATALGFIALCIIAAVFIRRFILLQSIKKLTPPGGGSIEYPVSLENLKINPAMTMALLIGYWTMFLYFKYQRRFNSGAANIVLPK
jgi:hypothetical protein